MNVTCKKDKNMNANGAHTPSLLISVWIFSSFKESIPKALNNTSNKTTKIAITIIELTSFIIVFLTSIFLFSLVFVYLLTVDVPFSSR